MGIMHDLHVGTELEELVPAQTTDGVSDETQVDMDNAMDGAYVVIFVHEGDTAAHTDLKLSLQDKAEDGTFSDYKTIDCSVAQDESEVYMEKITSYDQYIRADGFDNSSSDVTASAGIIAPLQDTT